MIIAKSNEHLQESDSKVKWKGWTENIKVIIWREIFAKNKNTKCPIDAHCHRHRRQDIRITKENLKLQNTHVQFPATKQQN